MAKTTPFDLLNPNVKDASKETRLERLAICDDCPRNLLGVCKECGCVLAFKTRIAVAECPQGLWGEEPA